MGISFFPGLFLARNARHVNGSGRGIVLGRQSLSMKGRRLAAWAERIRAYGHDLSADQVVQDDGWTETLFKTLGYPDMEAVDFTDAEGAQHVHDLNKPVPAALKGKFDVVIDGGTTEHIFHIGQALESCHAMLKPGGVMMSFVSADNWFGHGFFQSGPDVPWRYWHHCRGYEMLEVAAQERRGKQRYVPIPDPTGEPRGGRKNFGGPTLLLYAARKPMKARKYQSLVQGHYVKYV